MTGTTDFAVCTPVATSPPRRVCAEPGCHVRLSIYNHGRHCALHEPIGAGGPAAKCDRCGAVKPLDEEHWHLDRYRASGWHSICKACRGSEERSRRYEKRRVNERKGADAECSQCGRVMLRDGDHFSFGAKGRLVQPCLACQDTNRQRRVARTLDGYYRRKYGCTRDEYLARDGSCHAVVVIGKGGSERVMEVASEHGGSMATTEGARSVTCRPRGHYLNEQV